MKKEAELKKKEELWEEKTRWNIKRREDKRDKNREEEGEKLNQMKE